VSRRRPGRGRGVRRGDAAARVVLVAQALAIHRAGLPDVHRLPGATLVRIWLPGRSRCVGLCGRGTSAAAWSRGGTAQGQAGGAQGGAAERTLGRRRTRATWRATCRRGRRRATLCAGCLCGPRPWRAPRGPRPPCYLIAASLQEPRSPPCSHACRAPSWLQLSMSQRRCMRCLAAWLSAPTSAVAGCPVRGLSAPAWLLGSDSVCRASRRQACMC